MVGSGINAKQHLYNVARASDLIGFDHHGKRHAESIEMLLAATDFVGFAGAEFQEVFCTLRLADKVHGLARSCFTTAQSGVY